MKAQFTFLSGARAGQTSIFGQSYVTIGRHPQCELQFDADKDLDVSSRHATVALVGDLYVLRDLGSTNGTFVNGKRLAGDHVLATRDVVRFGLNGPEIEFSPIAAPRASPPALAVPAGAAGTVVFGIQDSSPPPPPPKLSPEQQQAPRRTPGPGTTTRVQVAVKRETQSLRRTALILFGLLLAMSGAYLWQASVTGKRLAEQRGQLLGQVDSLMQQIASLSAGSGELKAALDSVQSEAQRLKQQLGAAPDGAAISELRRRLDAAMRQQRNLAGAAQIDARAIVAQNRDAVALVFVEFPDKQVFTGTGFAVLSEPTGGLLITNKHVVVDSTTGQIASRIGVVFNGTGQNFRADLVRVHPDADLALLRVSVHRGFPVVRKLAPPTRTGAMGEPVAIMGFPLGLDIAYGDDWSKVGAAATLTLGTVSRVLPELLQLDSYGAQGSSGSPIFDRAGSVIGVLYGGQRGSNGRIIYGVPIRFVHETMADR